MSNLEIPELRVGSYLRYKADTDRCLSWLLDAAVESGYNIPQSNVSQQQAPETTQTLGEKLREKQALKAAKRKERDAPKMGASAVPLVKHVVRTRELIDQAKMVARKSVNVPLAIRHAFEHSITARKRCAIWYESSSKYSEQSNVQHQHFITVLENVFHILGPYVPPIQDQNGAAECVPLLNRFQALSVEDVEDIEDESEDTTLPTSSAFKAPEPKLEPAYEFEFEDSFDTDERRFAITCFFEDLRDLRGFVRETWQSYNEGTLDLRTTSFVTNAAIAIARKEEEALMDRFFPYGAMASQKKLVESLESSAWTTNTTDDDLKVPSLDNSFDDFVYNRPSCWIAKFSESYQYSNLDGLEWPFAVPLHDRAQVHPDEGHSLELPAFKGAEEAETYLTQLLLDLIHFVRCSNTWANSECPERERPPGYENAQAIEMRPMTLNFTDGFSRGFVEWVNTGALKDEISTWFAFAAQIQLDIRDVLKDRIPEANRHFEDLLEIMKENLKLKVTVDGDVAFDDRYWPRDPPSSDHPYQARIMSMVLGTRAHTMQAAKRMRMEQADFQNIRSTLRPSWEDMDSTTQEEKSKEILRSGTIEDYIKQRNERAILPAEDPHFLASSSPLICGTRVLELDLAMEQAGFEYANFNGYPFIAAHLYNAVRQENLLCSAWPEMEEFIRLHMGSLFLGHRTTYRKEMSHHYLYKIGLLPSSFVPKKKVRPKFKLGWKKGPQLTPLPVNVLLRDLYDDSSDMNMHQCLARLQSIFQQDSTSPSSTRAAHQQPQISSLKLLRLLRDSLPPVVRSVQFNYIGFTRLCLDLLKRIRFTIVSELGVDYSNIMTGREGWGGYGPTGSGYFMMISEILLEKEPGGPQMNIVAKVLDKYITGLGVP